MENKLDIIKLDFYYSKNPILKYPINIYKYI